MVVANQINVTLFRRSGERICHMQYYKDLQTKTKVRRSAGTTKRREAERIAANWEREVRDGSDASRPLQMRWADFRRRYEDEVCNSLEDSTGDKVATVFNVLERAMRPHLLRDVDADLLSRYQAWLRNHGREGIDQPPRTVPVVKLLFASPLGERLREVDGRGWFRPCVPEVPVQPVEGVPGSRSRGQECEEGTVGSGACRPDG